MKKKKRSVVLSKQDEELLIEISKKSITWNGKVSKGIEMLCGWYRKEKKIDSVKKYLKKIIN